MENARPVSASAADRRPAPPCPDPEALAAWVDQGLGAEERDRVTAHLAACDDCRTLVAHVLETSEALRSPTVARFPVPQAPRPRRRSLLVASSVLAAAAAVVLVVRVQPDWVRSLTTGTADSRLADLASAVGDERTVEARLTGGFRHGSLRAPVRSGGSLAPADWTLYAAAGKIRELAEQQSTAANLHALGVAHLIVGELDAAVQVLEDATTEAPGVARYEADLAAAYIARAKQLDRPDDLPRALGAAERALAVDGALPEARFNRALALEALFLVDQARTAWEAYLAVDHTSGWADEARRRLENLPVGATPVSDATRSHPPPLGNDTVEAGLDWLLRTGLPGWATAVHAGDAARATSDAAMLADYAATLSSLSDDPFATAIASLPTSGSEAARRHAEGVTALGEALRHMDAEAMPAAAAPLGVACDRLSGALIEFCLSHLGAIDAMRRNSVGARARAVRVAERAAAERWRYLAGRASMLDGFRLVMEGDFLAATASYRKAADQLLEARYRSSAGYASGQLAELLDLSGAPVDSWRTRMNALEAAALSDTSRLSYLALLSTAWGLARKGAYVPSRYFLDAADRVGSGAPGIQRLAGVSAAVTAALASGDVQGARALLASATSAIDASTDPRAARLRADVLALTAAVEWREGNPAAEQSLTSAIAIMGPERRLQRADALLTRAVIRASSSGTGDAAEADLTEALSILEGQGTVAGAAIGSTSTNPGAARATAAVIAANEQLQGLRGLALAERVKEAIDGVHVDRRIDPQTLEQQLARLRPGHVIVFYLQAADELLVWVARGAAVHFERREVSQRELERQTAVLSVQVQRTPQQEPLWRDGLAALYRQLLDGLPGVDTAERLTIVADGALMRVPFASLIDRKGAFVFERAVVAVAPHLVYAFDTAHRAPAGQTLVVGEPLLTDGVRNGLAKLPSARSEAIRVATQYPKATVVLGQHASRDVVLAQLAQASTFHFSGHALVPQGAPPRLLLAGSIADPRNWLDATTPDVVVKPGANIVLAGCETGAAPNERMTGISSIARGFLLAGAGSVVGTLWRIDDASAEAFFVDVHAHLRAGESPASAVVRAQRTCRDNPTCRRSVATWVGAVVYGATN